MVWGFKSCNFVHSANARPFVLRFLPFEFPSRRHLELWRNRAVPCPDPHTCQRWQFVCCCFLWTNKVKANSKRKHATVCCGWLFKQIGCIIKKRHKLTPTARPQTGRHSTSLVDCTWSSRRRVTFGCVRLLDSLWGELFWQHFRS